MTGPLTAINLAFVNIFNFKGRATRAEFWWVALFFFLIGIVTAGIDGMMLIQVMAIGDPVALYALRPFDFATTYTCLITAIPFFSLAVRRLHDVGVSGFWWLLNAIPLVGPLVLLVFYCMPSSTHTSIHGTPKSPAAGPKVTVDVHKRAMQGYAVLFDKDKAVTPAMQAARKAEVADYYRTRVLKSSPAV